MLLVESTLVTNGSNPHKRSRAIPIESSLTEMMKTCLGFVLAAVLLYGVVHSAESAPARWWKGNLHTHSFWSDGDDFPEVISKWYKDNGYHFLAISDHNILKNTEKWMPVDKQRSRDIAYAKYVESWGNEWVESKKDEKGRLQVRLKKLDEYRPKLEEKGRFLLVQSEEISARYLTSPVHMNAANLQYVIQPIIGSNVVDVIQKNIDAVLAQEKETGKPMLPHINHPNFQWAITAEELMRVRGGQFFEVYNGHPMVHNQGDARHAGCERVWDIINTWRITKLGLPLMYGLGTDDAHHYHNIAFGKSNAGRGWVMVRAPVLTTEAIIRAMKRGDFYSSSGVELADIQIDSGEYRIAIRAEKGVTYTTQFIGTKTGFDETNKPARNKAGEKLRLTHSYSDDVGSVLAEVSGLTPKYRFKGDEIYVRARIVSSRKHPNPAEENEFATAWTQPVLKRK